MNLKDKSASGLSPSSSLLSKRGTVFVLAIALIAHITANRIAAIAKLT